MFGTVPLPIGGWLLCSNEVVFRLQSLTTETKNDAIKAQNAKFAVKRITQDEFNSYFYPQNNPLNGKEGKEDQSKTYQKTEVL